jgi:hypothetical protein
MKNHIQITQSFYCGKDNFNIILSLHMKKLELSF